MKEAIEELIERYQRRINSLRVLIGENKHANTHALLRLNTKIQVYRNVIEELKQLLEDEQDKA